MRARSFAALASSVTASASGATTTAPSTPTWRRSYNIEDPRAQVSTTCWQTAGNQKHARKFFDVIGRAIWQYSDHVREAGKPMPICANALKVFEALASYMDYATGRCDPALDTLAARCKLSRRTVVRQLEVLRRMRIIDWVRRTEKTGNAPCEGPQRRQVSNAYFIDLARLPVEILRTLRQKLGDTLREAPTKLTGSGPVPSRMASKVGMLVAGLKGAFATQLGRERGAREHLATISDERRIAYMYRGDPDGLRQHLEMLGISEGKSASVKVALYPSSRTKE